MNWKNLGETFKSATGVSLAAGIVLLATYGKGLVDAALAAPALYKAYASVLPHGLWSAVLGTILSGGFHTFARSWHRKSLGIEVASILLGVTVVSVQLPSQEPSKLLNALIVGLVAGLGGLFLSKAGRSIFTRQPDDTRPDPSVPESD